MTYAIVWARPNKARKAAIAALAATMLSAGFFSAAFAQQPPAPWARPVSPRVSPGASPREAGWSALPAAARLPR